MVALRTLLAVLVAVALAGCPLVDPCEERQDLLDSPEGLVLTEEEHPAGWGEDECVQCHALQSTHQVNCTSNDGLDMEGVREAASDGEYETCVSCHGDNGVTW